MEHNFTRLLSPVNDASGDASPTRRRTLASWLWGAGGLISFGLGVLGAILPLIPTMPFILLAAFCFARSSRKLNAWFQSTKLYKSVFEGLLTRRSMTIVAKLKLLAPITLLLAVSFALMGSVPIGRIVVAIIFIGHIVYFGFIVKTDRPQANVLQRQQALQED